MKPKKWKIKKNKKTPDLISSIKKFKKDYIIPLRNEYKIKNDKSIVGLYYFYEMQKELIKKD